MAMVTVHNKGTSMTAESEPIPVSVFRSAPLILPENKLSAHPRMLDTRMVEPKIETKAEPPLKAEPRSNGSSVNGEPPEKKKKKGRGRPPETGEAPTAEAAYMREYRSKRAKYKKSTQTEPVDILDFKTRVTIQGTQTSVATTLNKIVIQWAAELEFIMQSNPGRAALICNEISARLAEATASHLADHALPLVSATPTVVRRPVPPRLAPKVMEEQQSRATVSALPTSKITFAPKP